MDVIILTFGAVVTIALANAWLLRD